MSEEKEYVRARWQRLEDARLQEGELEALETERKQLANAEEIKENLGGVEELVRLFGSELGDSAVVLSLERGSKDVGKGREVCSGCCRSG